MAKDTKDNVIETEAVAEETLAITNVKIDQTSLNVQNGKMTFGLTFIVADQNNNYVAGGGIQDTLENAEDLQKLLDVFGVANWETVSQAFARIRFTQETGKIKEIGNILADKWYTFKN